MVQNPQLATGILMHSLVYFYSSQLTACHAHPTSSAGAFSLLKFAL